MADIREKKLRIWDEEIPTEVTATCPWCLVDARLEAIGPTVETYRSGYRPDGEFVRVGRPYVCPRAECQKPTLLFFEFTIHQMGETYGHEVIGMTPRGKAKPMDGLPEEMENVRGEAWSCFYGGDYRASVVMSRAAVQRVVRTLGGEGSTIYHEIEDLHAKGKVTEQLKDVAHQVRSMAGEAAHPDELGHVTAHEARASLDFMDAFLEYTVALPTRLQRIKEREEPAEA